MRMSTSDVKVTVQGYTPGSFANHSHHSLSILITPSSMIHGWTWTRTVLWQEFHHQLCNLAREHSDGATFQESKFIKAIAITCLRWSSCCLRDHWRTSVPLTFQGSIRTTAIGTLSITFSLGAKYIGWGQKDLVVGNVGLCWTSF